MPRRRIKNRSALILNAAGCELIAARAEGAERLFAQTFKPPQKKIVALKWS